MAESYRGSRYYTPVRERDRDSDSEEDRYRSTTVTRYKVTPGRGTERYEVDDDRRSRYSARTSGDLLDQSRSAYDSYAGDRSRAVYYERDIERDARREPDRSRVAVYESREADRDWNRRPYRYEDDVKVEKKYEDRFDDDHGHEVERYRKETEYYAPADPLPPPVIIRQQAPEPQKIIVQEAPPPAPIIVPRPQPGVVVVRDREQDRELVRREREPYDEEYYYHHERRDVGPYRGDRDYALSRYERRHRRDDDYSWYSDDGEEDYYLRRRTVVRRERSESPHRHKRQLAEGALAGAGITALMSTRRDSSGEMQDNRGRKVLAGAALGALGSEALRRAHSAYGDRWLDSHTSPEGHSRLRKGLGIAAVALAAAGAAKFYQAGKIEKEEARRGRSRTRGYYSNDEYSHSVSRTVSRSISRSRSRSRTHSRPRSRRRSLSTIAKTALGTATTAGIIKHMRNRSKSKSSHSRHGSRSRSKSRLRRGAEVVGVAAAAGVANKLWKDHKKKEDASRRHSVSEEEREYRRRARAKGSSRGRAVSRSRSRSRSMATSPPSPSGADAELGLVEYGHDPLPPQHPSAAERHYDSQSEDWIPPRRRRRARSSSSSFSDPKPERRRSRSNLANAATAAAAAGTAAFGIKEYKDRKDRQKRDKRSRERRTSRDAEEDRIRFQEEHAREEHLDRHERRHHQSPPTASGGAYYPPYPSTPSSSAPGGEASYSQYPEASAGQRRNYPQFVPQDYTGYDPPPPPAPPGPPPPEPGMAGADYSPIAPGLPPGPPMPPPPSAGPSSSSGYPPDHVSDHSHRHSRRARGSAHDGLARDFSSSAASPPPPAPKSVSFIPLSPKSSQTLHRHKKEQAASANAALEKSAREQAARKRDEDKSDSRSMTRRSASTPRMVLDREEDVELLPDRFDDQGRPLDGSARRHGLTTRRGNFERPARHPGGWHVRGSWQVAGAEAQAVERLVNDVTDALAGQQSWVAVVGNVLESGLLHHADWHD